jgi:hypothetical protein
MGLTARPDTQLLSEVNDIVFESDCYRLEHEEKKLMLDRRNVRRVQSADVVD